MARRSDLAHCLASRLWRHYSQEGGVDDDHDAFLKRGVPAADIIDLYDYQQMGYWHTAQDTLDKVNARSIAIVGHVILESVNELQQKFR